MNFRKSYLETVIVVNPDRFSKQSFPPFIFLCKALLEADYKVKCLGAKRHSQIPVTKNFEFITPFKAGPKPIFYGVRFVLFSFFKAIKIAFGEKCSEIVVFRSCDSLTHCISSRLFGMRLVFFVDYLPWKSQKNILGSNLIEIIKNPQIFFQILGLCVAKKIVVSSNYLSQEIIKNIPFLRGKIFVETYTAEQYRETVIKDTMEKRKDILNKFSRDDGFIILAANPYIEIAIRSAACIENAILILQVDSADANFVMGLAQALGIIDRIELIGLESDLLELIPLIDVLILGGSGVYILTALSADVPVFARDSVEIREWIASEKFLFKSNSVQALIELLVKVQKNSTWSKDGIEQCKAHLKRFEGTWGQRAVTQLGH